jgi:hypothetical protein
MDAFWGPLTIYAGVFLAGVIILALSVPMEESDDHDKKQISNVLMTVGGGVASVGILGAGVKLLGELIEYLF